jgi:hypothetical protein
MQLVTTFNCIIIIAQEHLYFRLYCKKTAIEIISKNNRTLAFSTYFSFAIIFLSAFAITISMVGKRKAPLYHYTDEKGLDGNHQVWAHQGVN